MKRVIPLLLILVCLCAVAASRRQFFASKAAATAPPAGYTANATTFDGANDYMTIATALNMTNSTKFTFSCWVNFSGGDGADQNIFRFRNNNSYITKGTGNKLFFYIRGTSTDPAINATITNVITSSSGWVHFILSCDMTDTAKRAGYVNGVASTVTWDGYVNETLNYTSANGTVGATGAGANKFTGCMTELWFDNQYIVLADNISKFISDGNPVDLGADGSTPTGLQPAVYLKNAYGTFQNNLGYGGNYSVTGSLTDCTAP